MSNNNNMPPKTELGLLLTRYRGQRILIKAQEGATDAEILAALRGDGIVLTVVDVSDVKHPHHKTTRRAAKVGIHASNHLSIMREELINRERPSKGSSNAGVQAQE